MDIAHRPLMELSAPFVESHRPELITIEGASYFQIPFFKIVGLPNTEIVEARERIRAAFQASDLEFPKRNVVINLAPAHLPKTGTGLDLAIALKILCMSQRSKTHFEMNHCVAWGELGFEGEIKPVGRVARALEAARVHPKVDAIFMAPSDFQEAIQRIDENPNVNGLRELLQKLRCVEHLKGAWELLRGVHSASTHASTPSLAFNPKRNPNLDQNSPDTCLTLEPIVERAVLASASGLHHLLFVGPKGSGKTYASEVLAQLVRPHDPLIQWNRAVAETHPSTGQPWVRRVHPSVRPAGLLGQVRASGYLPGEIVLADQGILIADEFSEWARDSRECLRSPLETGEVILNRAGSARHNGLSRWQARFLFVGTSNLCPCGNDRCRCPASEKIKYTSRLSGPILDRVDLIAAVGARTEKRHSRPFTRLEILASRVDHARNLLLDTWSELPGRWSPSQTEEIWHLHGSQSVADRVPLISLRSRQKWIRLAATLAALDGLATPTPLHWIEAWQFRPERVFH